MTKQQPKTTSNSLASNYIDSKYKPSQFTQSGDILDQLLYFELGQQNQRKTILNIKEICNRVMIKEEDDNFEELLEEIQDLTETEDGDFRCSTCDQVNSIAKQR
tara:strand:+ start:88 stop:399 length:312 start_codon:yes stop_codon:yes gene_type:complete